MLISWTVYLHDQGYHVRDTTDPVTPLRLQSLLVMTPTPPQPVFLWKQEWLFWMTLNVCAQTPGGAVIPSVLGEPGSERCIQTVWRWSVGFCLLTSDCPPAPHSPSSPPSPPLYTPFLPSPLLCASSFFHRFQLIRNFQIKSAKVSETENEHNQPCPDGTAWISIAGHMLNVIVIRIQMCCPR